MSSAVIHVAAIATDEQEEEDEQSIWHCHLNFK